MTDDADLQPLVAADFLALADLLDSATGEQWDTPPRRSPDGTIRIILDDLTQGGVHKHFGTSVEGRSLQATDLDWSYGSGPALRGAAGDLAVMLCGRKLPAGRIEDEQH